MLITQNEKKKKKTFVFFYSRTSTFLYISDFLKKVWKICGPYLLYVG